MSAERHLSELWERRPGESEARWQAFVRYRDMPANDEQRSLRVLARRLGKSSTIVARWSREDGWSHRVASYDNHLDATKRAGKARELEAQAEREGRQLAAAAAQLSQPIVAYLRRIEQITSAGKDPFADWDLRELSREARTSARYLPAVIQAERLVLGLSSVNVGGHDGGAIKAEAQVRAESMSRSEAEAYLLGREVAPDRKAEGTE